jgi:hypothetical protein
MEYILWTLLINLKLNGNRTDEITWPYLFFVCAAPALAVLLREPSCKLAAALARTQLAQVVARHASSTHLDEASACIQQIRSD